MSNIELRSARNRATRIEKRSGKAAATLMLSALPMRRSCSAIGRRPQKFFLGEFAVGEFADLAAPSHHDDAVAHIHEFFGVGRGDEDRAPHFTEIRPDAFDLAPRADVDATC